MTIHASCPVLSSRLVGANEWWKNATTSSRLGVTPCSSLREHDVDSDAARECERELRTGRCREQLRDLRCGHTCDIEPVDARDDIADLDTRPRTRTIRNDLGDRHPPRFDRLVDVLRVELESRLACRLVVLHASRDEANVTQVGNPCAADRPVNMVAPWPRSTA